MPLGARQSGSNARRSEAVSALGHRGLACHPKSKQCREFVPTISTADEVASRNDEQASCGLASASTIINLFVPFPACRRMSKPTTTGSSARP